MSRQNVLSGMRVGWGGEFSAEMLLHFTGLKNLNKSPLFPCSDSLSRRGELVQIPMACKHQVLIVGDRLPTDSTVRSLISMHPDWEVRGVITNGKEVIEKILELMPHVVVLDMSGPVAPDSDCISEIRRIAPDIKVRVVRLANS